MTRPRVKWDAQKDAFIRDHYARQSYAQIAAHLFGTEDRADSIAKRLHVLGLKLSDDELRSRKTASGKAKLGKTKYGTAEAQAQAKRAQNSAHQRLPKSRAVKNKWAREWRKNHYLKHLLNVAKKRARSKGLEFSITASDVILHAICPIIGVAITAPGTWHGPSLDRRDNSLGYVPGNVHLVSKRGNTWKGHRASEDFERALSYLRGEQRTLRRSA